MNYDKPFLTYDEQITCKLINEYNLKVSDSDFAKNALISMSYYELVNGYQECFFENGTFKDDISIEYLYEFHRFNSSIQNILFKYSVYVETKFKAALAYVISEKFGVYQEDYLDIANFNNRHNYNKLEKTLRDIKSVYNNRNSDYIDQPTKHYKNNKNHIPAWILFKNVKFNTSINLYTFLMPSEKEKVCNLTVPSENITIADRKELLKKTLTITRKFRNTIAHNLKFVSYHTDEELPTYLLELFRGSLILEGDSDIGRNDIYSMIISLIVLLNDPFLIMDMIRELTIHIRTFSKESSVYEHYSSITNLPENLLDRLTTFKDAYLNTSNWTILDSSSNAETTNIIKGTSSKKYHLPDGPYYKRIVNYKAFSSEQEAIDAGYTKAKS